MLSESLVKGVGDAVGNGVSEAVQDADEVHLVLGGFVRLFPGSIVLRSFVLGSVVGRSWGRHEKFFEFGKVGKRWGSETRSLGAVLRSPRGCPDSAF